MPKIQIMMLNAFMDWLRTLLQDLTALTMGFFTVAIGYFTPIKDIVHLVVLFFIIDMAFGYLAARKLRRESFSKTIIFNTTIPRLLYSVIILMLLFLWDKVFDQFYVSSYKLIGWFLCGVLLTSILKNVYKITNWKIIPGIRRIVTNDIEKVTNLDIDEPNYEKQKSKD